MPVGLELFAGLGVAVVVGAMGEDRGTEIDLQAQINDRGWMMMIKRIQVMLAELLLLGRRLWLWVL